MRNLVIYASLIFLTACSSSYSESSDLFKEGQAAFDARNYELAIAKYKEAKSVRRGSFPAADFNIGASLWNLGQRQESIGWYESAYKATPYKRLYIERLASTNRSVGQTAKADRYKRTLAVMDAIEEATKKAEFKLEAMPDNTDADWAAYLNARADLDMWKAETYFDAGEEELARYYRSQAIDYREEAADVLAGPPPPSFMETLSTEMSKANMCLAWSNAAAVGATVPDHIASQCIGY